MIARAMKVKRRKALILVVDSLWPVKVMYVEQERGHEAKYVVKWKTSVINFSTRKRDIGHPDSRPRAGDAQTSRISGKG